MKEDRVLSNWSKANQQHHENVTLVVRVHRSGQTDEWTVGYGISDTETDELMEMEVSSMIVGSRDPEELAAIFLDLCDRAEGYLAPFGVLTQEELDQVPAAVDPEPHEDPDSAPDHY